MPPLLRFNSVVSSKSLRSVELSLEPGNLCAVFGPTGAGKSWLLDVARDKTKPASGKVICAQGVVSTFPGMVSRKLSPVQVAQRLGAKKPTTLTNSLTSSGLWERRAESVGSLSPSWQACADLLPIWIGPQPVASIDMVLDYLDPWQMERTLEAIQKERDAGRAFLIATNRIEVAEKASHLVVMRGGEARFVGTREDLLWREQPTEIEVETVDSSSALSVIEPLVIESAITPNGLLLRAREGQETAARLLTQGYGSVKMLFVKYPTLREALIDLLYEPYA